jgi:hypothetical protein
MSKYRSNYDLMLPPSVEESFRRTLHINETAGFVFGVHRKVIHFKKLPDRYLVAWLNRATRLSDAFYNLTLQGLEFDKLVASGDKRSKIRKAYEIIRTRSPREHFIMSQIQTVYIVAEAMDRRLTVAKPWIPLFCWCLEAPMTEGERSRKNDMLRDAASRALGSILEAAVKEAVLEAVLNADLSPEDSIKPKSPTRH